MSDSGEGVLLRLAQRIADGEPVDWRAAGVADEALIPCLKRLRILASIASACGMPKEAPPSADVLFRWGHLEIREEIGAGVSGEVFRGWDPALEREVAVKFLRAEAILAAPHVLQEGRLLARIRHPSVVTVHGAEQLDGRVGIWMEYIRGRTLEDLLHEEGTFAPQDSIQIGIDLCEALAAVHGAGFVHRDVKTRNVVREEGGRIVLMDLGAGIEERSAGIDGLAGTPIYLAPEILGGQPASPRSDLYSLGVLLYRLVTGRYPIAGNDLEALRGAHARGETRSLGRARPGLPSGFVRAVERALAADPARRFSSAQQMGAALGAALEARRQSARRRARNAMLISAAALVAFLAFSLQWRRAAGTGPRVARPPIAVADVVNRTQDEEMNALAGMLTLSLDQSQALSVLTRPRMSDLLARMGRKHDDRIDRAVGLEIGRQMNAAALLVLSVARTGSRYRLDLEAIDPRRRKRMFSAGVEATSKEQIPWLIDSLSLRVRTGIESDPTAIRSTARPVVQLTTTNFSAFHHFDRAERLIDRLDFQGARAELTRAVDLDSTFGLAHSRLAYVYWWQSDPIRERVELTKAFALLDRIPERQRYQLRAQGAMADRAGLEAARSVLLEMERFYPDDKEMLFDIGDFSSHLSEFPTAVEYLDKVIAMDPGCARALQHLARVYRDMGRPDPFLAWAKRYAGADSASDSFRLLGEAQIAAGDAATGLATLAHGRELAPQRNYEFTILMANACFFLGRDQDASRELDHLMRASPSTIEQSAIWHGRATGHLHGGAYREGLADLERAAAFARRGGDPAEEALARLDAATLCLLSRNDRRTAFRIIADAPDLEKRITYQDFYFQYWPYWGGRFKVLLLDGDIAAAEALAKQRFTADKWYGPYVASYLHAARGECAQALAAASRVLDWGPAAENIPLLYFLARCQLDHGQADAAAASLLRLQSLYSNLTVGSPYYAKSLLLLGKAYEKQGNVRLAAQSYDRLLQVWRHGDLDLPDRLAAQQLLGKIEAGASSAPRATASAAVHF